MEGETVPSENPAEEDPKLALENILKELMDAPGYVIAVAKVTPKQGGDLSFDFSYRRYHVNLEDLKQFKKWTIEHIENDLLT